jgi:hypothetical protein
MNNDSKSMSLPFDKPESQIGYHFKGMRDMIKSFGAVYVLKRHDGFQVLSAQDLENLSVDAPFR